MLVSSQEGSRRDQARLGSWQRPEASSQSNCFRASVMSSFDELDNPRGRPALDRRRGVQRVERRTALSAASSTRHGDISGESALPMRGQPGGLLPPIAARKVFGTSAGDCHGADRGASVASALDVTRSNSVE